MSNIWMNHLQDFRALQAPVRLQAAGLRFLRRSGISVLPRDEVLAARYRQYAASFDEIRGMLEIDAQIGYIGQHRSRVIGEDRWRSREDPGISRERWDRYRSLLRQLGVEAASHLGETITMRVATAGRASKGFVYRPSNKVLVSSLDHFPLPTEKHAHRVLEGSWHLYLAWG